MQKAVRLVIVVVMRIVRVTGGGNGGIGCGHD
jgi:hypothetical protein